MMNLNKTDRKILVAALAVLVLFSYFMYDDHLLFPRANDAGLEQVGEVFTSNNDVRLKTASAFSWFPAQKTDSVHLQDSIFTGERSQATIRLKDGSILQLKENSLVTMNVKAGQMTLDLRYGDVDSTLAAGQTLTVLSGGKQIEVSGTGKIHLSKTNGGEIDVNAGGGIKIKGAEHLAKKKLEEVSQIELLTPDHASFLRASEEEPMELRWKGTKIADYQYEICAQPDCSSALKSRVTRAQKVAMKEGLKDGAYYWRVKGFDRFGHEVAVSKIQAINVSIAASPVITTPPEWAKVSGIVKVRNASDPATAGTKISWEQNPRFVNYEYQFSPDPDYAKILQSKATTAATVETPAFTNGNYYYRVRGTFVNGKRSSWSPTAQIDVSLSPVVIGRMAIPHLNRKIYEFDAQREKKRSPASIPAPELRWSTVTDAKSYKVEFSVDENFTEPVAYNVDGNSIRWPDYKTGRWHVRVKAVDQDGIATPPSDVSILQVLTNVPQLKPVPSILLAAAQPGEKAKPVDFNTSWDGASDAGGYIIQMDTTNQFLKPTEIRAKKLSARLPIAMPGTYFLRVQATDKKGQPISNFSNVEKAVYDFSDYLSPPSLVEPFPQASIFLQTTARPLVWFEWKPSHGATKYEVEVAADEKFAKRVFLTNVNGNRYLLKNEVPVGSLYWRVRAVSANATSPWANPREFRIFSKKNEVFSQ